MTRRSGFAPGQHRMWAAHQAGLACLARCLVPVLLTVTVCIAFARWLGKSARELEDRSHTGLAVGVRAGSGEHAGS